MKPKNHVVSFSGGQTSGYMLRLLLDQHPDFREKFHVIFCNTGREHEKTLDFVHAVETEWQVPVTWLEYRRVPAADIDPLLVPEGRKRANLAKAAAAGDGAHWFVEVDFETAARRGIEGPFDSLLGWAKALPNVRGRSCSAFLKIRTIAKYMASLGVSERFDYIGIRADEAHRATEIRANQDDVSATPRFPLIDAKITKAHIDDFWTHNHFRLEIPNYEGNCDGCFLKARWKRLAFARNEPQHAQWWADRERDFEDRATGDGARWQAGRSYEGLIAEANHPELALNYAEEDVPCSCAVGGYRAPEGEE